MKLRASIYVFALLNPNFALEPMSLVTGSKSELYNLISFKSHIKNIKGGKGAKLLAPRRELVINRKLKRRIGSQINKGTNKQTKKITATAAIPVK